LTVWKQVTAYSEITPACYNPCISAGTDITVGGYGSQTVVSTSHR